MSTSDRGKARRGAFFGRRKGHALRPHQAQLFETLLPRLAIDVATTAPTELATLFPTPPKPCLGNGAALQNALGVVASEPPNDQAQQRRGC